MALALPCLRMHGKGLPWWDVYQLYNKSLESPGAGMDKGLEQTGSDLL
jgi:hypothetical protein